LTGTAGDEKARIVKLNINGPLEFIENHEFDLALFTSTHHYLYE